MANVAAQGSVYGLTGYYFDEIDLILESANPRLTDLIAGGTLSLNIDDQVVLHVSGLPVATVELFGEGSERGTRLIFDLEEALTAFEALPDDDPDEVEPAQCDLFVNFYPAQ